MRILLYRDATLECPLRAVANGLARVFASSEVSVGQELVELPGQLVRLDSYPALPRALRAEAASADLAVIGTTKRYENNYFYESNDPVAIVVSFANWDSLTSLPVSNGLVLFVAQ